ncbi:hypothetical protein X798_08060 [Onchocerca flexuosa]|uniref:Uncharacterized protein n=1 Tax=Onchocerca flexuosa TaxID=387005 RepID=A0A238BIH1_9BILA|nr:hypothetical protein X798_08060 [Onchocerca flexuosa]
MCGEDVWENGGAYVWLKIGVISTGLTVLKQMDGVEAKQPNSPSRNGWSHWKGHVVGNIAVVRFKTVKVANISLVALFKSKKERRI